MPTTIPNPASAIWSKNSLGLTDTSIINGVYKFMGCSIQSVSITLGFNGTASSASLTLVEDTQNGDSFVNPSIPSVWAFSFPKGGVGQPIIYVTSPPDLNPTDFNQSNVPSYFCGICTGYSRAKRDAGGKLITVSLTDCREMLSGIQCLLNGFALSQNIGTGFPRFTGINNVIDIFGYYNYGMESNRTEYGMEWSKIKDVIEAVRVTLKEINLEFVFTGDTFSAVPTYYRISDDIIDIAGLCQKVTDDSGSDYITINRKIGTNDVVVEIRGIRRTNTDVLTQTELEDFVTARTDIVENYKIGREYRNETTGSIIIGGMRNTNYVAYPSEYKTSLHLTGGLEDYNVFEPDIKARLFGGYVRTYTDPTNGSDTSVSSGFLDINSGAILPFWGFSPDDHAYPLIEPFLPMDHFAFDKDSDSYGQLTSKIPLCKLSVGNWTVRRVTHTDMFLDGDGDSDSRPFAYISSVIPSGTIVPSGYMRGIPLNTEILRAAAISTDSFKSIFYIYYPEIASNLFGKPSFDQLKNKMDFDIRFNIYQTNFNDYLARISTYSDKAGGFTRDGQGRVVKTDFSGAGTIAAQDLDAVLEKFAEIIAEQIRQYALDNMGRKFLVCLPKSNIMQRIWNNLPVPTNVNKPEIEYVVDNRGYWEEVPVELDGIVNSGSSSSSFSTEEEEQIRRKFMAEDGRFFAMVGIDAHPTGNINFNSNGNNQAMFQDFPTSEFRPSKLTSSPSFVLVSCSVNQLIKRPDLALLELPAQISFDPLDGTDYLDNLHNYISAPLQEERIARVSDIIRMIWYFIKRDNNLRSAIKTAANAAGESFLTFASKLANHWAYKMSIEESQPYQEGLSHEFVMDLKGVVIPLTSTWVSYGPWYPDYAQAKGNIRIESDETLVPWNFTRPTPPDPWYTNLDAAGFERLSRTISDLDYMDNAQIIVAGFPEVGLASGVGYNSNLTGLSLDFGLGGVKTTYNFSTYAGRAGTYRKSEYDNLSRARIDVRERLPEVENINVIAAAELRTGTNRFNY
jgi:hypothetical protein